MLTVRQPKRPRRGWRGEKGEDGQKGRDDDDHFARGNYSKWSPDKEDNGKGSDIELLKPRKRRLMRIWKGIEKFVDHVTALHDEFMIYRVKIRSVVCAAKGEYEQILRSICTAKLCTRSCANLAPLTAPTEEYNCGLSVSTDFKANSGYHNLFLEWSQKFHLNSKNDNCVKITRATWGRGQKCDEQTLRRTGASYLYVRNKCFRRDNVLYTVGKHRESETRLNGFASFNMRNFKFRTVSSVTLSKLTHSEHIPCK